MFCLCLGLGVLSYIWFYFHVSFYWMDRPGSAGAGVRLGQQGWEPGDCGLIDGLEWVFQLTYALTYLMT
jgi:hypothetical protein